MTPGLVLALLVGLWILNLVISWWNARQCGLFWAEAKVLGGFARFLVWCVAIMSACGFTMCYGIVLLPGFYALQHFCIEAGQPLLLTEEGLVAGMSLLYLVVMPFVLFTGFVMWLTSLYVAWKERDALSIGVASWNTFAQVHNTYEAMRGAPEAFGKVFEMFAKGDKKGNGIIIALVVLALCLGIMTTWAIIYKYAGRRPLPERSDLEANAARA